MKGRKPWGEEEESGCSQRVTVASSLRARVRGLLGRDGYDGVLMLVPCRDIHTLGMRFPIDVAFIGVDGHVLAVHRGVPPARRLRCRQAYAVLEREADPSSRWFAKGDRLHVEKGTFKGRAPKPTEEGAPVMAAAPGASAI